MKQSLRALKAEFKIAQRKYQKLMDELEKRSDEVNLPRLKAQYEGKFFRYENSSGPGNSWPIFSYCKKVTSQREAIADNFESTPYQHEFKINEKTFHHIFQTEITAEEYYAAVIRFTSSCILLSQNFTNRE